VALEIIRAAREAGARVVVDPKGGDPIRYRGADLLKPNRRELAHATGMPVATESDIVAAARAVIERCGFGAILVSLGPKGMVLIEQNGGVHTQRAEIREVYDSSGAGDTVVAMLGAALGAGISAVDGARLANIAAGIVVGKVGTAVAHPSELAAWIAGNDLRSSEKVMPRLHALDQVERWRRQGLRVGFTNGCFDLLHPGHVSLLRQAKLACDRLVVGLNSDASAARLAGPTRPLQTEQVRAAVLASLAAVDLIVIFDEDTPLELVRAMRPQLLVKGADYRLEDVVGAKIVEDSGGEVMLAEVMPGFGSRPGAARTAPPA
jgi:D-beta-D-heptose 7-phosphate kinase / D-beta-D-heptose 1-phosphate adenosyltransferase